MNRGEYEYPHNHEYQNTCQYQNKLLTKIPKSEGRNIFDLVLQFLLLAIKEKNDNGVHNVLPDTIAASVRQRY